MRITDRIRKKIEEEGGQAIVEFAVSLPLLLMLLCGVIDFGWIFTGQYQVDYAVYEAARYAGINAGTVECDELERGIDGIVNKNMPSCAKNTIITSEGTDGGSGEVSVEVKCDIPTLTFVGGSIFDNKFESRVRYTSVTLASQNGCEDQEYADQGSEEGSSSDQVSDDQDPGKDKHDNDRGGDHHWWFWW